MMKILNIFLILLASLSSCKGQNLSVKSKAELDSKESTLFMADTVQNLGKNIMLVYQDKKNNYWFGSWENGLYKYDGKTIFHFASLNESNRIEEIKEDSAGNVYFNTENGIVKYDGKDFQILKVSNENKTWKLEPKDLWFKNGWDSDSVLRYDGKDLYKIKLPTTKIGEEYISENPNNANPYTVYSIYKDSKGNVWFGTAALGVLYINNYFFDWILEKDVVEIYNEANEGSNGVRSIMEDKDGFFWFNSQFRYEIIDQIDRKDNKFYKREKGIGSLDGKIEGEFFEYLSIAKDNKDKLWFATYDAGVYHYNGKNISHYQVQIGDQQIKIFSIYKDNDGKLWLGTHESGAYWFNGKEFIKFEL